jgi:hypothetical protein
MAGYIHDAWEERGLIEKYGIDLYCWMLNFVVNDFKRVPIKERKALAELMLVYMKHKDRFVSYMNEYDRGLAEKLEAMAAQ